MVNLHFAVMLISLVMVVATRTTVAPFFAIGPRTWILNCGPTAEGGTGRRIGGAAIGTGRLGESDGWRKEVEERVNVALVYLNG